MNRYIWRELDVGDIWAGLIVGVVLRLVDAPAWAAIVSGLAVIAVGCVVDALHGILVALRGIQDDMRRNS